MAHQDRSIFLQELLPVELPSSVGVRFVRLSLEAMFLMAFALVVPFLLNITQGAMIALFMASSSLMHRARQLLKENQTNIWQQKMGGWQANRISILSVMALFLGLFLANMMFALGLMASGSEKTLHSFFDFVLRAENLQTSQPLAERFSSFWGILLNNVLVLATTLMLGLLYRMYGMMLVLSWNACVWAVVILYVFQQAWLTTKVSTASFVIRALGGMLPHLILEAAAYVIAALAAVFLSKGFTKYQTSDPRFRMVAKASFTMLAIACGTILLAAAIEVSLPPFLLPSK